MKNDRVNELPGKSVTPPDDPMVVGRIARPVGLHGEVKVTEFTGCATCLLEPRDVTIKVNDEFRLIKVTHISPSGKWMRYKVDGVSTPEQAALLNGAEIVIPFSERPAKQSNEYYVEDLIGCSVLSDDDMDIGFVREVWHQDHHDIWVVDGPVGEVLIPAVKEFILEVDVVKHRIIVRHIEGLWDEH